jgi:hypothetical protein
MAIKVKVQRDYLLTEFSVEASASELDDVLKSIKTSGKSITLYNNGAVQGINVEQKTKLTEAQSVQIRELINIGDKIL